MNDAAWIAVGVGLLSAMSLPVGCVIGLVSRPSNKITSALMAFGAGALIFALTIEIVAHAHHKAGFGPVALGCVLGGLIFTGLNKVLNSQGAFLRKAATLVRYLTHQKRQRADELL